MACHQTVLHFPSVLMILIFVCVGIMNRFTSEDDEESMVTL